jgi:thiol-disulfide isomerase/thioredoxin
LNFWASWCTPCLEEFPSLVKLQRKYKENKNILILTVNTDDSEILKKVKKIVERYKLNFPIVLDKNGKLVEKFSIAAIPVSIIYKDGKVYEVSNMAKDFYSGEFLELLASWKI